MSIVLDYICLYDEFMGEISKILGNKVRQLRKRRGLSQEDYAEFVGINLKTLWNIETGKRSIRFDILEKIIKAEEIPVYSLFFTEGETEENNKKQLKDTILELVEKLDNHELETIKNLLKMIDSKR